MAYYYERNNEPRLVSVTREALPGENYRFFGVYDDGFEVVLRAKATRPYTHAAIHSSGVTTKFRGMKEPSGVQDRRQHVTFHSSANIRPSHSQDTILQVVKIDEATR